MSDPSMIKKIMETVTIPVMAKARIGHFVECQVTHKSPLLSEEEPASYFLPSVSTAHHKLQVMILIPSSLSRFSKPSA